MTVISEGLLLNSKYIYIKVGRKEEGFQAFLTQPPVVLFAMRSVTVIDLRLCDRKKSLHCRCSSLWTLVDKIHIRRE